jgi:transposase
MSLKPSPNQPVPEQTAAVARAAFPKGNLYLRLRDELGTVYDDGEFEHLYPERGQPGLPPWRLALVTVFQFLETLSDRQAAEAVRARIDWKYALGLELTDPGFDFSVLSEFRARLIAGAAEQILLDRLLTHFRKRGLLKVRGRQRTDSTHVLAAIRVMNRLELVAETLRAALNDIATLAPDWLRELSPAAWYERYGQRIEDTRLPHGEARRVEYALTVGQDGFHLLEAVALDSTPEAVKELPVLATLRTTWERHYERDEAGKVSWRAGPDLTRAATAIESPYDTEARHSTRHSLKWTGYKVHLTETCEPDQVHLITNVHTTVATKQDVSCTEPIHDSLQKRDLLPGRHLVDTGYVGSELLVASQERYQVELFGPTRYNPSWQAREGGFDHSHFQIDWENRRATCPEGKQSYGWYRSVTKPHLHAVLHVHFAEADCLPCPSRSKCVRSPTKGRGLILRQREHHAALQQARSRIASEAGRLEYQKRAGVEGTLSQGVRRMDLRQSRYVGLAKTHLQHLATAAAMNVVRLVEHLEGRPQAKTRVSRFAALRPA